MDRTPPILVVMLDGLGDRPWDVLDGLTPLQAADTPNLDSFAQASATGLLAPLGPGRAPGTDLAHFVLFGYAEESYPGRAVFEAAGHGIELTPGQVVMHALLADVRRMPDDTLEIVRRYPHRDEATAGRLMDAIATFQHGGYSMRLTHTIGDQGLLVIDGGASPEITDTDPHNDGWPVGTVRPIAPPSDPAVSLTADAVSEYLAQAYVTLREVSGATGPESPFPLLKWTGRRAVLPRFEDLTGMEGVVISSAGLFEGLCLELGLEHRRVPYDANDSEADMRERLAEGLRALDGGAPFVLVHDKAPDEAGHTKDPRRKRDVIAGIDRALAGLDRRVGMAPDTIVVVTGDHGTPAGTSLIHSGDPVPLAILADALAPDTVSAFDGLSCAGGRLGHLRGSDLMPVLLNLRGTVRYTGGRLSPQVGLHWPRSYQPFSVAETRD